MFKEIAIEPAAVAGSSLGFKYIIEKFGISEGRLIAAFPSKWKRQVYQAAKERLKGKADLSRLVFRLEKLTDESFYRRSRPGDGCSEDWLKAATNEHARLPFDAIISVAPSELPMVFDVDELDDEHYCLQPNRQWHIDRNATAMASCCAPLLSRARHIKFVDPHFDLSQGRFHRPFMEFLKHIQPGATVDIFRGDGHSPIFVSQNFKKILDRIRPEGVKVQIFLLPERTLHNRFVLTEAGGLLFPIGLDDKNDRELTSDLVIVLQPSAWKIEWIKYTGEEPIATYLVEPDKIKK
jgi:hypothetical protein